MGRRPQKLELTWFNKDQALIPTEEGAYGYAWVDPNDPRYCETHTLIFEESISGSMSSKEENTVYSDRADLPPTEDNLLILGESGDVLESLVRVPELADKYVGQIKCVYIDPPFNTEQTFTNYEDNLEHSVWLTMMRDRLVRLHTLLRHDGSIWVHLDTVENHRMRVLLDEIFGSRNFVAEIAWHKTTSSKNDNSGISQDHDIIAVYRKSPLVTWNGIERSEASNAAYANHDNDPRGPWREDNYKMRDGSVYPITHPVSKELIYPPAGQEWRFSEATHQKHVAEDRVWWGATGNYSLPKFKRFRSDVADFRVPDSLWTKDFADTNRRAKQHLKNIFPGEEEFATPKPERLLERIIHIATDPGDIVLDVFGGSGTTAAVAHKMCRRWVTCELLEETVTRYIRPRLRKVVNNEDPEGITLTKGERVDATADGLTEGVSPEQAQDFTSILTKILSDQKNLKNSAEIKQLKMLAKTVKSKDTVNWRGGGSFKVARLSQSCFDYDPDLDLVMLTQAATGQNLIASVAANLNFRLTPNHLYFHGVRGSMRLAVVEGRLTRSKCDDLVAHLELDDGLTIAATEIEDGTRQYLRSLGRGCRAVHVPSEIFPYAASEDQ